MLCPLASLFCTYKLGVLIAFGTKRDSITEGRKHNDVYDSAVNELLLVYTLLSLLLI